MHRNKIDTERNRVLGFLSLKYNPIRHIQIEARSGIDRSFDHITHRFYNDTYVLAPKGNYVQRTYDILEWNSDFMATMARYDHSKWQYKVSLGGSLRSGSILTRQNSAGGLIKENLFSFDNALNPDITENIVRSKLSSVYAFGFVSYQNAIFLEVSGRNDWSSTLPSTSWSYFYPSIGTSILFHKILALPVEISQFKCRASFAQVGNEIQPYLTSSGYFFNSGGRLGYLTRSSIKPFLDLNPEITNSMEIGTKLGFINDHLILDLTYYRSNSRNQLLSVPLTVTSGYSSKLINAGNIQNTGVELILKGKLLIREHLDWSSSFTIAQRRDIALHSCIEKKYDQARNTERIFLHDLLLT